MRLVTNNISLLFLVPTELAGEAFFSNIDFRAETEPVLDFAGSSFFSTCCLPWTEGEILVWGEATVFFSGLD